MTTTAHPLLHHLADAAERYGVPGAQLATRVGNQVESLACGVVEVGGGRAVTTRTPFLAGSITKMLAALLVLDAAERGELDLNRPVDEQGVPGWDDTPLTLMAHTSGRANVMPEPADTVASFAARVAAMPRVHPPGRFSYCNPAWSALELLLEASTGTDFETLATDRLLTPLGIAPQFGIPPHGSRSHEIATAGDGPRVVPEMDLRAASAAGSRWWCTADDLLRVAAVHLEGGAGVISPAVAAAQAKAQVAIPGATVGDAWCLGCVTTRRGEVDVIGWDGYTLGQRARLRIYPALGAAFALLTNAAGPFTGGAGGSALADDLLDRFEARLGLPPRPATGDRAVAVAAERLCGDYGPVQIESLAGGLHLTASALGLPDATPLTRLAGNTFSFQPREPGGLTITFDDRCVYVGPILFPRD